MPTERQNLLAANLLRAESVRLQRVADDLQAFVVEETPQSILDYIAETRKSATEHEDAAQAFHNRKED